MATRQITYRALSEVDQSALLALMNDDAIRAHLIQHPYFTMDDLNAWVASKYEVDCLPGCRVCAVMVNDELAGWCGIQPDDEGYELAIVISKSHWGLGLQVFRDMMSWASEMGHAEVLFHLLETRRTYRALGKMAKEVRRSERLGRTFSTYVLSTDTDK